MKRSDRQPSTVSRQPREANGFTLIEVLAALIIVALGMLAVITSVTETASNTTYLRDKTLAHWIAMNRLTEARLEAQAPKVDKTSGEVEMANRRWRWEMEVKQTDVDTVLRIDVSVRDKDGPEKSSLATVSGFFGKAIAPAGTTAILWGGAPPGGPRRPGGRGRGGDQDPTKHPRPPVPPPGGEPTDPPIEPPPDPGLER